METFLEFVMQEGLDEPTAWHAAHFRFIEQLLEGEAADREAENLRQSAFYGFRPLIVQDKTCERV